MADRNLVLFEDDRVCPEALTFAREYCLRMDRDVTLLILASIPSPISASVGSSRNAIQGVWQWAGKMSNDLSSEFLRHGISVNTTLRVGEPGRELLKFLAERPPFRVIIWGSDDTLPKQYPNGRAHWMVETTKVLECPIYAVSQRASDLTNKENDHL